MSNQGYLIAPEEQVRAPGRKAGGFVRRGLKNNGYVWLAALGSAGLALFVGFCHGMLGDGTTVLRMDLFHQYGPLFAELYDRITGLRSLLYSWNTGLGGNFLGNFYNYLSSPTLLLTLVFGHRNIPEAIGMMVLVKCAAASGFFAYFLRKVFKKNDASIAAFGILYSFCAFFIAYYWNVMWIDAMAVLPLLALGIHKIVHERRLLLYVCTLAFALVSNYYMGFMLCVFSVLFFLVQAANAFETPKPLEDGKPDKAAVKTQRLHIFKSFALFGLGSLLAGAIAAFALLPVFFAARACSATGDTFPQQEKFATIFQIFEFIVNHFADMNPTIRSSGDTVLPNVYAGVAAVLLLPLYLMLPSRCVKQQEKITYTALLGFLFLSFAYKPLNFIWHAMHTPNDLPYRFSFIYSFILLYMAYRAFMHIKEIPVRSILAAGGGAVLFLVLAEKLGQGNLQEYTIYLNIGFLLVYTLLFIAISQADVKKRSSMALLLFCVVLTEVSASDTINFEIDQKKVNFAEDYEDFQKVKQNILGQDGDLFFRMELTKLRALMDPAWFGYNGVSTFSSMAYQKTANLEYRLGLDSNFINSYTYSPQTPVYNAMHNLKYVIENSKHSSGGAYNLRDTLNPALYERRGELTHARFTVFENRFHLPLAYWTPGRVKTWVTDNDRDPFVIQTRYWELATGAADVFEPLEFSVDTVYEDDKFVSAYADGKNVSYSGKTDGQEGVVSLTVATEKPQNVYIYVDLHDLNAVRMDRGEDSKIYYQGGRAIRDLGVVTPEEPLAVKIFVSEGGKESGSFNVYTYGLNMEAFERGYNFLRQNPLALTEFSDTRIKGNVTAPRDGMLYTSIPYDEGWKVIVDGKALDKKYYIAVGDYKKEGAPAGGLLGFALKRGAHEIELRFEPRGLLEGAAVSAGALLALVLCCLFVLLKKRTQKNVRQEEPAQPLFSTEGLTPEAFSLDVAYEGDMPAQALPEGEEGDSLPTMEELARMDMEEIAAEYAPVTVLPEQEEQPSANTILLDMQRRAEELRRKIDENPVQESGQESGIRGQESGGDGPTFRIV